MPDRVVSLPCPHCLWEASVVSSAAYWALRLRLRAHLEVAHAPPLRLRAT